MLQIPRKMTGHVASFETTLADRILIELDTGERLSFKASHLEPLEEENNDSHESGERRSLKWNTWGAGHGTDKLRATEHFDEACAVVSTSWGGQ
eukprot:Skav207729  [mRNA]  locus=scaffold362:217709:224104:- [translate_table: standard]